MYSTAFEKAVDHAMLYEVGKHWKLTPAAEAGLIDTKENRRACGYVNDPDDRGGETKYGVAKNANPDLDITNLDWEAAKRVYYKKYWLQGDCDKMPPRLAALHFDGCVNHGVGRVAKFIQTAVGATVDGDIGPATLALLANFDEIALCHAICDLREQFYKLIVERNPTQQKFLNGWLTRISEMREFVTNQENMFE